MEQGEIVGAEPPGFQQGQSQRIAHDQAGRGAGRGRQLQGAGLLADADIETHCRRVAQGGIKLARQGDEGRVQPLDEGQQGDQFPGLAGIGQGQDHIVLGDHAQVAMAGLAGVNEKSGRASAGQSRRDLVGDVPRFPHAKGRHPSLAVQDGATGGGETLIDARFQRAHGLLFRVDDRPRPPEEFFSVGFVAQSVHDCMLAA